MSSSRSKIQKLSPSLTRSLERSLWRPVGTFRNRSVKPYWTVFMTTKLIRASICVVAFFVIGGSILAHHGTGTYDSTKSVTLSGTVTEFAFTNPHAALYFDVKDASGKIVNWAIEMNS